VKKVKFRDSSQVYNAGYENMIISQVFVASIKKHSENKAIKNSSHTPPYEGADKALKPLWKSHH